ncbi:MAG: hypothetical protein MHM6MM_008127 [Cercozoa sp. M6MM]
MSYFSIDSPDYISAEELAAMLRRASVIATSNGEQQDREVVVVDVRDEDRAELGYIVGSQHVPSDVFSECVDELAEQYACTNAIIVFHCMYSQVRGPSCARLFLNRLQNLQSENEHVAGEANVQVYVLEGGFRAFLQLHRQAKEDDLVQLY